MNRCETCKHWGVAATFTLPDGRVKSFDSPIFLTNARQCLVLEEELDQDGEPCAGNAHLGTPPNFGCVHWEGKE